MAQEADVPRGLWAQIEKLIDDKISQFARSGFLRNASISGGAGLTIKDGGVLSLIGANGWTQFYIGPVAPSKLDGSPQPGWVVARADGTPVLIMRDAFPAVDGTLNQALTWLDRAGNVVIADDTDSGQGIARPYVPGTFYRADYADWVAVTGTSFVTKFRARMTKQQPKLYVRAWASNDTAGSTGELRILVNGTPWGPVQPTAFAISEVEWGPLPVDGDHMSSLIVELQGRVKSGAGGVRLEPSRLEGRQT